MKRINKFVYLYVLQGFYTRDMGWEDLTAEDNYTDIVTRLKEYRENDDYSLMFRIIHRRELNPKWECVK